MWLQDFLCLTLSGENDLAAYATGRETDGRQCSMPPSMGRKRKNSANNLFGYYGAANIQSK